jgi:hypothetical protein
MEHYVLRSAPITEMFAGSKEVEKSNCQYCERYADKLWSEKGITAGNRREGEFCGLRICQICILYIST